jgi:hypothetical protein
VLDVDDVVELVLLLVVDEDVELLLLVLEDVEDELEVDDDVVLLLVLDVEVELVVVLEVDVVVVVEQGQVVMTCPNPSMNEKPAELVAEPSLTPLSMMSLFELLPLDL